MESECEITAAGVPAKSGEAHLVIDGAALLAALAGGQPQQEPEQE